MRDQLYSASTLLCCATEIYTGASLGLLLTKGLLDYACHCRALRLRAGGSWHHTTLVCTCATRITFDARGGAAPFERTATFSKCGIACPCQSRAKGTAMVALLTGSFASQVSLNGSFTICGAPPARMVFVGVMVAVCSCAMMGEAVFVVATTTLSWAGGAGAPSWLRDRK
mmetsp:Transcript_26703/g.50176  ORF Transcript_26703/g.50176 Transcript_26703/m.50176 type:complete len:170 (-) Transcript_26703:1059-1568(-)